jgi:uncharacterized membrane protein (GlpM family)
MMSLKNIDFKILTAYFQIIAYFCFFVKLVFFKKKCMQRKALHLRYT